MYTIIFFKQEINKQNSKLIKKQRNDTGCIVFDYKFYFD